MASVRYMVSDVEQSVEFYRRNLGFELKEQMGPAIAILVRSDLTLWVSGPPSSAARPMPDGRVPESGGWNRFVLEVQNLQSLVDSLKQSGARFRNDIVSGPGGRQILLEDPDGNPVELFESR